MSQSNRGRRKERGSAAPQSGANRLAYTPLGDVRQILTSNGAGNGEPNRQASRVPPSHPEGYLKGFATIYSDAADAILTARSECAPGDFPFLSVADGVAGLASIDAAVRSSVSGGTWTRLEL